MISISSLAQRFRPRPAVLPSTVSMLPTTSANQHTLATPSAIFTPTFPLTSATASESAMKSSLPDSSNLVGDPVLGSSHSRFPAQDLERPFGSYPMHLLTPIVSSSVQVSQQRNELIKCLVFLFYVLIGKIIKNLEPKERKNLRPEGHEYGSGTKRIYWRSGSARFPAEIRSNYPRSGRTQHRTQQPASQSPTAMPRGDPQFYH